MDIFKVLSRYIKAANLIFGKGCTRSCQLLAEGVCVRVCVYAITKIFILIISKKRYFTDVLFVF